MDHTTVYDFDSAVDIELVGDGDRFTISVHGLDVDPGVRLRASMDPGDVDRLAEAGSMGLAGEATDVDWDPDLRVDVTFHLVDELAADELVGDGEPLLLQLGGDDESVPVRSIDAWRIGTAVQRLSVPGDDSATLEIGISTERNV